MESRDYGRGGTTPLPERISVGVEGAFAIFSVIAAVGHHNNMAMGGAYEPIHGVFSLLFTITAAIRVSTQGCDMACADRLNWPHFITVLLLWLCPFVDFERDRTMSEWLAMLRLLYGTLSILMLMCSCQRSKGDYTTPSDGICCAHAAEHPLVECASLLTELAFLIFSIIAEICHHYHIPLGGVYEPLHRCFAVLLTTSALVKVGALGIDRAMSDRLSWPLFALLPLLWIGPLVEFDRRDLMDEWFATLQELYAIFAVVLVLCSLSRTRPTAAPGVCCGRAARSSAVARSFVLVELAFIIFCLWASICAEWFIPMGGFYEPMLRQFTLLLTFTAIIKVASVGFDAAFTERLDWPHYLALPLLWFGPLTDFRRADTTAQWLRLLRLIYLALAVSMLICSYHKLQRGFDDVEKHEPLHPGERSGDVDDELMELNGVRE